MYREMKIAKLATRTAAAFSIGAALMCTAARGEQTHVTRYDAFVGYSYLQSSHVDLTANGIHFQAGVRPSKWYSIGFDYSNLKGELTLTPGVLPTDLQDRLKAQLGALAAAGRLPAGYALVVPTDSHTQTFTVGPQLAIRKWTAVTLFIRPSIGLIREVAEPQPQDAIAKAVVTQLAPEGKKKDWTWFYGAGAGFDINFTPHFALRTQADYVWDHLFPDIIATGRPTFRFSIGPAFNFGKNIIRQ